MATDSGDAADRQSRSGDPARAPKDLADGPSHGGVPALEAVDMPDLVRMMGYLEGMVYRCRNDADWTMTYVSDGCKPLTGYEPSDLLHNLDISYEELIHENDRERVRQTVEQALRKGRAFMVDYRIRAADGEVRWVHERGYHGGGSGESAMLEGFITDISDLKRGADENRLLGDALKSVAEAVLVTDLDTRIVYANDSFVETYGFSRDELEGLTLGELNLHLERPTTLEAIAEKTLHGGWKGELMNRRKDGTALPVHLSTSVVRDELGRPIGLIGVSRDLTEEKRIQQQLQQSQRMEALGQLAGGVAHDFNNLLTVVQGCSERLASEMEPADPAIAVVGQITSACERGAALTRQLLGFSREQVVQPKTLDLNEQIGETRTLIQSLIGDGVRLTTRLRPGVGPIHADPGQIDQILLNLAANARDAMPDGGDLFVETESVEPEASFRERTGLDAKRYVRVEMCDTGCGMDGATQERAIEPFFTTKRNSRGTGLGLATVHEIVQQNAGHLQLSSEPGVGTRVEIFFPETDAELRTTPVPLSPVETERGSETVLVVDDELLVRDLTARLLQYSGYQVLKASSGEEALSVAARHGGPVHLLLTDVLMPGMSGHELAQRLREFMPGISIIYSTGYNANTIGELRANGVQAHVVQKPYTGDALLKAVRQVLGDGEDSTRASGT